MTFSDNSRGALLMMTSMAAFTINDAMMKVASVGVGFYQGIVIRGCMLCLGLFLFVVVTRQLRFRPSGRDWGLILLRSAMEAVGTYFFLKALLSMPIANLSAIMQSLPLTVTLAAALFLGETVGWRRVTAIVVGFVGVLLIVRPATDSFTIFSLYGILAVAVVTVRDLTARRLSADVPSGIPALAAAIVVTVLAALGSASEPWGAVDPGSLAVLFIAAICLMVGYVAAVSAMRVGDIGTIAPFRYTSLLVALILGLLLFGEWPDFVTLIGAGIIVGSGLFTLYRQRNVKSEAELVERFR